MGKKSGSNGGYGDKFRIDYIEYINTGIIGIGLKDLKLIDEYESPIIVHDKFYINNEKELLKSLEINNKTHLILTTDHSELFYYSRPAIDFLNIKAAKRLLYVNISLGFSGQMYFTDGVKNWLINSISSKTNKKYKF